MPAPARYFVESDGNTIFADHYNSEFNNIREGMLPRNFSAVSTNASLWGAVTDPGESGSESLPTDTTGEIRRLKSVLKEITGKSYPYASPSVNLTQIYPVGSIIAHYDFNAAVSVDLNTWAYCNGQTISDSTSPINGLVTPDLSNRYLVGFGIEANTDIGSATFNSTVVGNASHQINTTHTHELTGTHTHVADHSHPAGTLQFKFMEGGTRSGVPPKQSYNTYSSSGTSLDLLYFSGSFASGATAAMQSDYSRLTDPSLPAVYTPVNGTGSTSTKNINTTAGTNTVSASGGSSTQSIQPRSVRVRYLVRYK